MTSAGTFVPTSGQAEAIDLFRQFMKTSVREWQVFSLCGFAGTGKTTLVRHLVETMRSDADDDDSDPVVRVVAPTGKAASVLRRKGFPATTVHALLYQPNVRRFKDSDGVEREELTFELKVPDMESSTRLIVCDEASMVDGEMALDLRSLGVKVLAIGDPFQLPPVRAYGALPLLFDADSPDVMLTEVTRQAHDSPVLHLATVIRERQVLLRGTMGDSVVCTRQQAGDLTVTGQAPLIVGLNRTRHAQNFSIRRLLGFSGWRPEVSDRLICRRNDRRSGLVNGEIHVVTQTFPSADITQRLTLGVRLEDSELTREVTAWAQPFRGLDGEQELGRLPMRARRQCQEFHYGYAITCHASQGSEWPAVIVIDEGESFGADRWRWLYTAITRASERVAVIS